ncbi:MAG: phosphodiesterase, family [Clostridiales bacterium]|jgi:hypothetical protein|nr:phosphodiesterase, family [Clostridiales bacterium]
MKICVLSDTHIPRRAGWIPEIVTEAAKKADLIIHAGDIVDEEVLDYLKELAPIHAVLGNMDPPELNLPRKQVVEIYGFKIGIVHGDGWGGSTVERAYKTFSEELDCIVFGHSHQAYQRYHGNTLMFNPGSPTDRRRSPKHSFGMLEIDQQIKASIIYF